MKKSLIALAVLGLSGAAMAQSSVTLYGVADAGVGKMQGASALKPSTDASNKTQFISGSLMNNTDSRLGVRGIEDMGGGLKAGYNFETGVNLNDGSATSGNFWARQANLWLSSDWGTIKLGRQFTVSYLANGTYELTGQANYSAVGNTYNYVGLSQRANSAFAYITPTFNGLTAAVAYISKNDCVANVAGTIGAGPICGVNVWDAGVLYGNGPVAAGLSVNKATGGKTGYQLGGKYTIQNFQVAASFTQAANVLGLSANNPNSWATATNPNAAMASINAVRRGFGLGGTATFGAFSATLDLTRDVKNEWSNGRKYTNGTVELKYALSKRTFVYGAYLRLDSTNNYGLGIRHNF